jgi:hypothetical protein
MTKPRISHVDPSSMAPGFETFDALKRSKQAEDYWAKVNSKPARQAAE